VPNLSLDARKQRLRVAIRTRLASISAEDARRVGESISVVVPEWSGWHSVSSVALFATLPGEVETEPLIRRIQRDGKHLLLPRMIGNGSLEFAEVDDLECLRAGRYGVREPNAGCPARRLGRHSVVFVPGLAFDSECRRLGRGAGYYDRALAEYKVSPDRPRFIGLAFAAQIVDAVPVGSHDVPMDGLVTEAEFIQPA
jgi:5-formyltetrahydrofolate cyclo-ligase